MPRPPPPQIIKEKQGTGTYFAGDENLTLDATQASRLYKCFLSRNRLSLSLLPLFAAAPAF